MTAAIRAELFKLRSTRMYYGLLGIGVGLTALIAAVLAGQAGSSSLLPSLATEVGQRDIVTNTGFALLTATVFGALVSSGEFRHRTVTDTYLDQPDRVRVMLAKIVAALAGGAVIGAAAAAVATVAGTLSAKGPVLLSAGDFVRYAAGSVLGAALLAAIGCVAGTLIRSQVGAVITVFVWCLAIEQILAGVSRSAAVPAAARRDHDGRRRRPGRHAAAAERHPSAAAGRDGRPAGRRHAGAGRRRRAHGKPRYLITTVVRRPTGANRRNAHGGAQRPACGTRRGTQRRR
jgi:ABC-2 type transport system permease protein